MHNILEGALQYEMKEMLLVFTREKGYFTLNTLNQRIKEFSYFYADMKDKPSEITLHSTDKSGQDQTNFFFQQLLPVAIHFILCKIGPLIRHWCMRYEAKHSYFKRLPKMIGTSETSVKLWRVDTSG